MRTEGSSIVDEPGGADLLCARIKGANRDVSEAKADLWPRSVFFLRRPTRSGERARFVGCFSGMHRALNDWMLSRAPTLPGQCLHQHGPRYYNFPYFWTMCDLEKFGHVEPKLIAA